jgi:hypothetical protein
MTKIEITQDQIVQTSHALRNFGRLRLEGLVLWLGKIDGLFADVEKIFIPPQNPIRDEYGVGYIVTGDTLFEINRMLHETGLRLIAQVHSHPGRAYHSEADDSYAVATREGSFSIVVPDFGEGKADIHQWAIFQLRNAAWTELSHEEIATVFSVQGSINNQETTKKWLGWWRR